MGQHKVKCLSPVMFCFFPDCFRFKDPEKVNNIRRKIRIQTHKMGASHINENPEFLKKKM